MKKFELSDYGVERLSEQEAKQANGGVFWYVAIAVGLAIAAGDTIMKDWDNFKAGFGLQPPV